MNPLRSLNDLVQAADQESRLARMEALIDESGLNDTLLESIVSLLGYAFRKRVEQRTAETPELAFCSFCHRSQKEVRALVTTGEVGICDQCADIAIDTLRSTGSKRAPWAPRSGP